MTYHLTRNSQRERSAGDEKGSEVRRRERKESGGDTSVLGEMQLQFFQTRQTISGGIVKWSLYRDKEFRVLEVGNGMILASMLVRIRAMAIR